MPCLREAIPIDCHGGWAALQKVLALTAAKSSKFDVALADFCDIVMPEIYQSAINADATVAADFASKVPSYGALKTVSGGRIEATGMEKHHAAVQTWTKQLFQQVLGRLPTQDELDSMPAIPLRRIVHQGAHGAASFHAILRESLVNGRNYSVADILSELETAYDDWGPQSGPIYWKVARAWLCGEGIR